MRPHSRKDFTIAIICALTLEAEAVEDLFDETYDRLSAAYGKHPNDRNAYINGRIGKHNLVLCYLPGMGIRSAASVATSLRFSYTEIQVAFLVGICGGAPHPSSDQHIFLGDVLISDAVIEYDFGRQYPGEFQRKTDVRDTLGRPDQEIRSLLAGIRARKTRNALEAKMSQYIDDIQQASIQWRHPRFDDILYKASYHHKHYNGTSSTRCRCQDNNTPDIICEDALKKPCNIVGCDENQSIRRRHHTESNRPSIHIGTIASANTVMKSGQHREKVVQDDQVIGFEMEGAGVWDNLSCIIIKGVCDYADSHKNKSWQAYAAANGASAAKAFLKYWRPTAREANRFQIPLDLTAVPAIEEFIGRQDDLNRLWDYLQPGSSPSRKVAILHGLGGIGKTQLAIHFAREHKHDFTAIFWLRGNNKSALVQSLSSCLPRIQGRPEDIEVTTEEEVDQKAKQVLQWLALPDNPNWLIILDNIDQYSPLQENKNSGFDIKAYFPNADHGSILITSRLQRVVELGKSIPVERLASKDATHLLLQSCGPVADDTIKGGLDQDVTRLVTQLGGLPLAIVIAGAFMRETGTGIKEYLEYYQNSRSELQSQSEPTRHYPQGNILRTWDVSYHEIQKRDPAAAVLLLYLAFFDNRDIWNQLGFKARIKTLVGFSLIQHKQQEESYGLHPVVQDWCIHVAAIENHTFQLSELALVSIGYMVPGKKNINYARIQQRLLPHASHLVQRKIDRDAASSTAVWAAFNSLGKLYSDQGRLKEAEAMYQRALAGREHALGPDHIATLNTVNNIGNLYKYHSKLEEAETMYQRALAGREQALGPNHIHTLDTVSNLGSLYKNQGKLKEAEAMYQRALAGYKQTLGPEHHKTRIVFNNLVALAHFSVGADHLMQQAPRASSSQFI
ncbi:hypothetical protein FE257_004238 [Aspergillus nanangensis]|uniref:Nucleoside phosphorylase domain-containing protein n=1 Tax=Aspergillus nanangensis TaxID=2582783 RepID=A0AAD4CS05_ASPNN|nr:hypothetical protein FE257_004238 [Aspergillus nanangensis]